MKFHVWHCFLFGFGRVFVEVDLERDRTNGKMPPPLQPRTVSGPAAEVVCVTHGLFMDRLIKAIDLVFMGLRQLPCKILQLVMKRTSALSLTSVACDCPYSNGWDTWWEALAGLDPHLGGWAWTALDVDYTPWEWHDHNSIHQKNVFCWLCRSHGQCRSKKLDNWMHQHDIVFVL